MSDVLALIPARAGSKGIPNKNFKPLPGGPNAVERAIDCALDAGCREIVVSSDCEGGAFSWRHRDGVSIEQLWRPLELAGDTVPMIDVVKHALAEIPGPSDQIILLIQPTQPLRQPKHLRAAIDLLESSGADSVVSVVELPLTHHPWVQLNLDDEGRLELYEPQEWSQMPATRQEMSRLRTFIRDGTVYAFHRSSVDQFGTIYGEDVRPLIIPPDETCALDTPSDWAEAERRLRAQAHDEAL